MPIAQILLASGSGAPPTPTYTLTPAANSVNEGSELTFTVGGTNIPNGTYYWNTDTGDLDGFAGEVIITNNSGSFSVTPTADVTTEGAETFTATLRLGSVDGTILATSSSVTINDTSIAPSPFSAIFNSDDSILQGQNGWWGYVQNGGGAWLAASAFSVSAPTYNSITYPDTVTTGNTYDFTAGQYLISPTLVRAGAWATTAISIDFWFYPTANGIQLLTELGQPELSADYHTTLLEIDSSSYVKARFWQTGGGLAQVITSSNTVNLNQWNHIYFVEDTNGAHTFALNGVATTGNPTYTRTMPTTAGVANIHYAVGGSDTTNMGNTGGFQGKIGNLKIHDHVESSTYTDGYYSKFFAPTYALYRSATDVDEGSSIQISIGGTNVPPGTYYWTIETGASEFATTSGSFEVAIIDGILTGSATLTPTEDVTTEGAETVTVALRSGSITGTILATSDSFTINDTSFAVGGQYAFNGTPTSWATTNATSTTYGAYTYPDESSGSLHTLTGSEFLMSGDIGNNTVLNINLWFYPTANNLIIMGEMGQAAENSYWHYSMLDIDNTNHLRGRLWSFVGATSTGTVTLNAWNHAYLYYNSVTSSVGLSLNNETAVTINTGARQLSDTSETYLGIGILDSQNMSSSTRYQGKFADLVIDTTLTGSNYTASNAKYIV